MGQINFTRGLISENLILRAQFGLNWEDWNFKIPNLIFTKLIDWNQMQNYKKIKVLGSIRGFNWRNSQPKINLQNEPNYKDLIDKNRGWNWKFSGQFMVKLYKSKTKDQIAKCV
jgi:hypothetical protein